MRRKISNFICVLLISSLTLLGCNSENNTTNLAVGCYYVPGSEYGYYWVQCFI